MKLYSAIVGLKAVLGVQNVVTIIERESQQRNRDEYVDVRIRNYIKPECLAREQKDSILILFLIEAISFEAFILLKPFCGRLI